MANVPSNVVATHLRMPPLAFRQQARRRAPAATTQPHGRPVSKVEPDHGPEALVDDEFAPERGYNSGKQGGRRLGYVPSPVFYGAAGFRGAPVVVYPRGYADPTTHPPGNLNRHFLRPKVGQNDLGSRIVTARFQRPATSFGTIQAIARGIIDQLGMTGYDVTPTRPFRGTGIGINANPPPAGLFGVIPSVMDRWFSFRDGFGMGRGGFAFGQRMWKRTDPPGSMTHTSSQAARFRMQAAWKYRLTYRPPPGVNPALDVEGSLT